MKIWIVEDEAKVADFLKSDLHREGYFVDVTPNVEGIQRALGETSFQPDVLILDRLLDQYDTINLIPKFRETYPALKILVLSAINTANEKAAALDAGADDYLGKPFASTELIARIRAISRRQQTAQTNFLKLGNLVLDVIGRTIVINNERLNLPNKEFLVLRTLIQQPGKVFNRNTLFEQVWDASAEQETNVVEATITNLRRKLEEASANLKIRNMRGVGYWVEA